MGKVAPAGRAQGADVGWALGDSASSREPSRPSLSRQRAQVRLRGPRETQALPLASAPPCLGWGDPEGAQGVGGPCLKPPRSHDSRRVASPSRPLREEKELLPTPDLRGGSCLAPPGNLAWGPPRSPRHRSAPPAAGSASEWLAGSSPAVPLPTSHGGTRGSSCREGPGPWQAGHHPGSADWTWWDGRPSRFGWGQNTGPWPSSGCVAQVLAPPPARPESLPPGPKCPTAPVAPAAGLPRWAAPDHQPSALPTPHWAPGAWLPTQGQPSPPRSPSPGTIPRKGTEVPWAPGQGALAAGGCVGVSGEGLAGEGSARACGHRLQAWAGGRSSGTTGLTSFWPCHHRRSRGMEVLYREPPAEGGREWGDFGVKTGLGPWPWWRAHWREKPWPGVPEPCHRVPRHQPPPRHLPQEASLAQLAPARGGRVGLGPWGTWGPTSLGSGRGHIPALSLWGGGSQKHRGGVASLPQGQPCASCFGGAPGGGTWQQHQP